MREATEGNSSNSQLPGVAVSSMDGSVSIDIKGKGESSSSSDRPNKWLNSIMEEGTAILLSRKPKIQTVQPFLRRVETNKDSFDPKVVSIGPCHHGKLELQPIERLKIPMVREFVKQRKVEIYELYEEVVKVAQKARECYAEGLIPEEFNNDEEFAHMMFLDGCFILHYICSIVDGKNKEELNKIKKIALVRRDLLLLENQLPFLVLKVLMRASKIAQEKITAFIKCTSEPPHKAENLSRQQIVVSKIDPEFQMQDGNAKEDDDKPVHLLELVQRHFIDPEAFGIGCAVTSGWYSRRSAKEFKTVGILCKPSKTCRFTDIEFKSKWSSGILRLPKMIIDDTTKSMLLNLVAYEACPDNANDHLGVTSYICFMDSIIDQEEDVKELRSTGILMNYLGSDKQVADLFNDMTTELAPSSRAYERVKMGIENHHHSSLKGWIAECHHTHLRSPWTCIAVVAAIFALGLSVAQTVLAAIQTHLTAYPPQD